MHMCVFVCLCVCVCGWVGVFILEKGRKKKAIIEKVCVCFLTLTFQNRNIEEISPLFLLPSGEAVDVNTLDEFGLPLPKKSQYR